MSNDRYSRFTVLKGVGKRGLRRIRKASVAVVGVGGLGCVSAAQLAALGVGLLRIVDRDVVDLSNLQRQQLFTEKDIGTPKVEVAQRRLQEFNPDVTIETMGLSVTEATANRIVEGMTVVVDGLDSFSPRYALNRACIRNKVPYIFAGALGSQGNMTTIIPGKTPCLECILGGISDRQPTCATVGIYPTILGVIANLQVHEALRIILGRPPNLANQLLVVDIETLPFDIVPITRHENCPVCGSQAQLEDTKIKQAFLVTELCAKNTFLVHSTKAVPIDINRAAKILQSRYQIIAKSTLGVQIQFASNVQVSIVGEGNIMVKGISSPEEAEAIYHQILNEIQDALLEKT